MGGGGLHTSGNMKIDKYKYKHKYKYKPKCKYNVKRMQKKQIEGCTMDPLVGMQIFTKQIQSQM